jgi:DNA-binding transcriptional MerR regulator
MRLSSVALLILALCLLLRAAAAEMWQEELQTRLGRLPYALIRLATWQLPRQERDDYADEWRAELAFVLRDTDGLPITRLFRGIRFAIGLLRVSRSIARELSPCDEQQALVFGEEMTAVPEDVGYRGPTACTAAGITYRQLDYWARTGLVEPSLRAAVDGSGWPRLYGFRDILELKIIKRLLDTGISLRQIRAAVAYVRERCPSDLAQVTLMSEGESVYVCTSPDEVVDLLQGGQGVFGIALGRVWREVEDSLADLPAERT